MRDIRGLLHREIHKHEREPIDDGSRARVERHLFLIRCGDGEVLVCATHGSVSAKKKNAVNGTMDARMSVRMDDARCIPLFLRIGARFRH